MRSFADASAEDEGLLPTDQSIDDNTMNLVSRIISSAALAVMAGFPTLTLASTTFLLEYDGVSLGNTAQAFGSITFATVPPNPSDETFLFPHFLTDYAPDNIVTDFSLTVSGAASGNGAFGLSDFEYFSWNTKDVELDLTQNLIGQITTDGRLWASDQGAGGFGLGAAPGSNAPNSLQWYYLATSEGTGDLLKLTSFAPVPLPAAVWLFGTAISGLMVGALRRRSAAVEA